MKGLSFKEPSKIPAHIPDRRAFMKQAGRLGLACAAAGMLGGLSCAQAGTGQPAAASAPYHHYNGGFRNPQGSPQSQAGIWDHVGHVWNQMVKSDPKPPWEHCLSPTQATSGLEAAGENDYVTWLGHCAVLLRLSGRIVLLDPFLSDYATGLPPFGPRRFCPPGLRVDELPPIDALIVSHNHYDHLDRVTVEALPGKDRIQVIAPLRLGGFFSDLGFTKVKELDWHDGIDLEPLRITCLPAIHFSRRGLADGNQTLWAGYSLATPDRRVFFSGDTGYGPIFPELGQKYGPFDLGLIAVGAYLPIRMMEAIHANPEEGVRLGRDLGARALAPMHWGAVVLGDEPPFEPPARFLKAGLEAGYSRDDLWLMKVGETRILA